MDEEEQFLNHVNLIAVLDYSGRGGNAFFLSLFDLHPEVLTCPWMHYSYSYLDAVFSGKGSLLPQEVLDTWTQKSYFRFVFNDLDENSKAQVIRFGGNPDAPLDRALVRETFARLVRSRAAVSTREIILFTYLAFAKGFGRNLSGIRYVLVSDAVSLRIENPLQGFSGRIVPKMMRDFPEMRIIGLVRDPRATFTSCRQQFVNANGNMYGIRPGNFLRKLSSLAKLDLTPEDCAFLYWILYFSAAVRTIFRIRSGNPDRFLFVRNEDLNLDFRDSIASVCAWLGISAFAGWNQPDYVPTMVGKPWRGTGAFNNRYQRNHHGPLKNDSDAIADKITGPNAYVTERWKTRLAPREIRILEHLFRDDMRIFAYAPLPPRREPAGAIATALRMLLPFRGELPTLPWILNGRHLGAAEIANRLFYAIAFPPFYVLARFMLLSKAFLGGFFALDPGDLGEPITGKTRV